MNEEWYLVKEGTPSCPDTTWRASRGGYSLKVEADIQYGGRAWHWSCVIVEDDFEVKGRTWSCESAKREAEETYEDLSGIPFALPTPLQDACAEGTEKS